MSFGWRRAAEHELSGRDVDFTGSWACTPHGEFHVRLHVMKKDPAVRESVQRHRERMRRAGFRLVQLWVPDTRARGFTQECRRQSRAAARNERGEREAMDWIEANEDAEGWTG
jgi:antidote-toxin recognition MazE-like antitoxin